MAAAIHGATRTIERWADIIEECSWWMRETGQGDYFECLPGEHEEQALVAARDDDGTPKIPPIRALVEFMISRSKNEAKLGTTREGCVISTHRRLREALQDARQDNLQPSSRPSSSGKRKLNPSSSGSEKGITRLSLGLLGMEEAGRALRSVEETCRALRWFYDSALQDEREIGLKNMECAKAARQIRAVTTFMLSKNEAHCPTAMAPEIFKLKAVSVREREVRALLKLLYAARRLTTLRPHCQHCTGRHYLSDSL